MFKDGEAWRHRNTTEIDVVFWKVTYRGTNYIRAKVLYLNRQAFLPENHLIDTEVQTVRVLRKDFKNWSLINGW